ncbi:hypothetical protein [Candidatus Nanohalobium constans]|nr:hypothetical protein [Candidatus Nanohalobium constans]
MNDARLGLCVICGSRVHSGESHVEAIEGYCHRTCLATTDIIKA